EGREELAQFGKLPVLPPIKLHTGVVYLNRQASIRLGDRHHVYWSAADLFLSHSGTNMAVAAGKCEGLLQVACSLPCSVLKTVPGGNEVRNVDELRGRTVVSIAPELAPEIYRPSAPHHTRVATPSPFVIVLVRKHLVITVVHIALL